MKEIRTVSQLIDALSRGEKYIVGPRTRLQPVYQPSKEEQNFCISVAGHRIAVHSQYADVARLCEPYFCDLPPECEIRITDEDIAFERRDSQSTSYSRREGYFETLSLYRKISEEVLAYNTFLMHGAVVASKDCAFMFTAPSGTGKTTQIKKWLDQVEGAFVVNGDKPLIKVTETEALACGTPWCGKENMGTNTMVPLKAIVLMKRGVDNLMEEIAYGEAYSFLLQQTYWPSAADKQKKTLELLSELKGKVRFFSFIFNNFKDDALSVPYHALMAGSEQ